MMSNHQFVKGLQRNRLITFCLLRHFHILWKKKTLGLPSQVLRTCSNFYAEKDYQLHSYRSCAFKSTCNGHMWTRSFHSGSCTLSKTDVKKHQVAGSVQNEDNSEEKGVCFEEDSVVEKAPGEMISLLKNRNDKLNCMSFRDENNTQPTVFVDKSLAQTRTSVREPVSIIDSILEASEQHADSDAALSADLQATHPGSSVPAAYGETSLSTEQRSSKVYIPPLSSVAPVVNESAVLRGLVDLGVDVSMYVAAGMAVRVMQMDWHSQVEPYVLLLHNAGVSPENLATVLTKNPYMFEHDVEHLQVRINYLQSKRFSKAQIEQMLVRHPVFLCMDTKRIDAKLGFYQREFRLKGPELRTVVSSYAKLITNSAELFKRNKAYMKKFLEFSDSELRTFFLTSPKTFFQDMRAVSAKFDYLHNVMGLPRHQIAHSAWAFNRSQLLMEARHKFLLRQGRAQYDPTQENYVSLNALLTTDKQQFCEETAKSSVTEFDNFQRLI